MAKPLERKECIRRKLHMNEYVTFIALFSIILQLTRNMYNKDGSVALQRIIFEWQCHGQRWPFRLLIFSRVREETTWNNLFQTLIIFYQGLHRVVTENF